MSRERKTGSRSLHRKIKLSEQWDRRTAYCTSRAPAARRWAARSSRVMGRAGDAANVILTAVGYNLRLVLAWLRAFLRVILHALIRALATPSPLKPAC